LSREARGYRSYEVNGIRSSLNALRRRLASLLRPERPPERPYAQTYEEDQVRARIYGWHSGTVEPPQPLDSSRLAAVQLDSASVDEPGDE
jgi:hypothetical protein